MWQGHWNMRKESRMAGKAGIIMKKIAAIVLSCMMCISLAACGSSDKGRTDTDTEIRSGDAAENSVRDGSAMETADVKEESSFNLETGTVMLNSGYEMPVLGIGMFRLSQSEAENSVYWALSDGYRLIDTAKIYGNEEGVGKGIKRAIDEGLVKREEIFVTTKMWTDDYDDGAEAIEASLRKLNLDYIDLMILHHSQPENDVDAYKAMEKAVKEGKLKSIGLSNYYEPDDFDRLVKATEITPALLQNETHPYHQSMKMKEHLKQYGTVMESWFPLGGRGNTQRLFEDETISEIAKAHGKTSAQIILRWHLQAGNIAIPGSSNEDHIQENYEIFDFELTDEEMEQMTALDKDERFASY
jgi:diketogulonate reductase-like aldo/keto reductase